MKTIFTFLLTTVYMFGLTLSLNSAKEDGKPYGILHIEDDKPILCETKIKAYDKKLYLCMFDGDLQNQLQDKKTPFAHIDFVSKENKFYIYIKPLAYSLLINTDAKLYDSKTTPLLKKDISKHWTLLLYDDKTLFKRGSEGINFPITYSKFQYPSIGTLDLNGKPMDYAKSDDINIYLDLKKAYNKGAYENALSIADKLIKNYPDSIFVSDILLYRLKSMDKILDINPDDPSIDKTDITTQTKAWLKTFSTDKNRPEALLILVKQYIKLRSKNDVNYYLDMLLSEFPKDSSTQKAILLYADNLYKNKKRTQAIKLYEDVLYASKDLDVASQAAMKLAKTSLSKGKNQKAKEYLEKILSANADFILKDKTQSYKIAQELAKANLPKIATQIVELLLTESKKFDENREMLLKDAGIWNEKAGNTDKAYTYLKRYQKEFPSGDYEVLVQQALDSLFFKLDETNSTKLLAYYDKLIEKYNNDIGKKAIRAKIKLLLSQKKYGDILALQDKILKDKNDTKSNQMIEDAATFFMQENIKLDNCREVVEVATKYKNALPKVKDDKGLYKCFTRVYRFESAKNIAKKYIHEQNLALRLQWLLRFQHSLYKLGEYKKSIEVAKDEEILGKMLNEKRAHLALYDRFYALAKLKKYDEALEIAKKIELNLPDQFANVEVYAKVVNFAKEQGNDLVVETYAKRALEIEKRYNSYLLSPKLEYDYINSLQKLQRFQEANKIALELLTRDLNPKQKTRALYTIAESFIKIDDEQNAKTYFQQCANLDKNSSWSSICSENLKLYN